jgi:hypothetical protein
MTTSDARDVGRELASLTPLLLDPARAAALRLRCRSELTRRAEAERGQRAASVIRVLTRMFVPALLGTFSAFYAAALFRATLRFEGWLR